MDHYTQSGPTSSDAGPDYLFEGMKSFTGNLKGGGRGASGSLLNEDGGRWFQTIAASAKSVFSQTGRMAAMHEHALLIPGGLG